MNPQLHSRCEAPVMRSLAYFLQTVAPALSDAAELASFHFTYSGRQAPKPT